MRSRLALRFAYLRGQTRLVEVQADPVFKVTRPVSLPDGSGLQLILMSPAPGIFGGDHWEISVEAEPGTRVHLTTQGALRVHPSSASKVARQELHYILQPEAELLIYSDPVIPFAHSHLRQTATMEVHADARIGFWEAFLAGRLAYGEAWCFEELHTETALYCQGKLLYLDRNSLLPKSSLSHPRFQLGSFPAWASAIWHGDQFDQNSSLHSTEGVVATDALDDRLQLTRLLAKDGQQLRQVQQAWLRACAFPSALQPAQV